MFRRLAVGPESVVPDSGGSPNIQRSTALGASNIFRRFLIVALGVILVMGSAMVIYDVSATIGARQESLEHAGLQAATVCERLRGEYPSLTDEQVVQHASLLTNLDMALLTPEGELLLATNAALSESFVDHVYGGAPSVGVQSHIAEELGRLSGLWMLRTFGRDRLLLIIVPRRAEQEGLLLYMTISAGVLAVGIGVSFLTMLLAANWMVRRPVNRLVTRLTSALEKDVQRRREAERIAVEAKQSVEEHSRFLDNLLNATHEVGIVATDDTGRIQLFNRAAQQITGYDACETVGLRSLEDLQMSAHGPAMNDTLAGPGAIDPREERIVDRWGNERLLAVNRSDIVSTDGRYQGRLVVFMDMTERKRLEAELKLNELQLLQSAKMASLGEMATGVAHELNQPLNNIALLASRLQRTGTGEEPQWVAEKLHGIQQQVSRASKIIAQLQTFARPSVRTLGAVDVRRATQNVLAMIGTQLQGRGIEVRVEWGAEVPAVRADEAHLEQVLINLLNNARDALADRPPVADKPRIRIRSEVSVAAGGAQRLRLMVSDNGPGVPPEALDRIFEPFFTTKEVGKGTGLGLSISYGLVHGMGGQLWLATSTGPGATFIVDLPVADTDAQGRETRWTAVSEGVSGKAS